MQTSRQRCAQLRAPVTPYSDRYSSPRECRASPPSQARCLLSCAAKQWGARGRGICQSRSVRRRRRLRLKTTRKHCDERRARQHDLRLVELPLDCEQLVCLGWVLFGEHPQKIDDGRQFLAALCADRSSTDRCAAGAGSRAWYFCSAAPQSSSPAVPSVFACRHWFWNFSM